MNPSDIPEDLDSAYFSRNARYTIAEEGVVLIDHQILLGLDDWTELIFRAAHGEHTVAEFIAMICKPYPGGAPPQLPDQTREVIWNLVQDGYIALHPAEKVLRYYFALPVEQQDSRRAQLLMEADAREQQQQPSPAGTPPPLAAVTLKVDYEHLQFRREDGSEAAGYVFAPALAVVLDSAGYDILLPPQLADKVPNSVQLTVEAEQYSTAWHPGQERHVLSAETLDALLGSIPFAGLKNGKTGTVAIGHLDGGDFYVYWASGFKVQAAPLA